VINGAAIPFPGFTGALREGNDIGIVALERAPSAAVPRYEIYTGRAETGSEYEVVGFGVTGSGSTGAIVEDGHRRRGWNTFDATMAETFGQFRGWTGGAGVLISDFDNGLAANDALGVFYGIPGLGLREREASMAPGDSGAPAFIDGRIAGVASFRLRLSFVGGGSSDIDDISNASFGEFNAFTRVSHYSSWIQPVPEPGTAALSIALFGIVGARLARRNNRRRGRDGGSWAGYAHAHPDSDQDVAGHSQKGGGSELAATLRRDRKAVKRDVTLLESFGLVNAREEINPGHGRKRVIEPRAAKYQLVATI
jgi:hypothetical protein